MDLALPASYFAKSWTTSIPLVLLPWFVMQHIQIFTWFWTPSSFLIQCFLVRNIHPVPEVWLFLPWLTIASIPIVQHPLSSSMLESVWEGIQFAYGPCILLDLRICMGGNTFCLWSLLVPSPSKRSTSSLLMVVLIIIIIYSCTTARTTRGIHIV